MTTKFKALADKKGWTLTDIGKRWGIGRRQMGNISNNPKKRDLDALAGLPVKKPPK